MTEPRPTLITIMIVFGIVACICAVVTAILFAMGGEAGSLQGFSLALGFISTIISIILSVVAVIYSYISGNKTTQLLNDIQDQYKAFVDKLNAERMKSSLGAESIKRILKK